MSVDDAPKLEIGKEYACVAVLKKPHHS